MQQITQLQTNKKANTPKIIFLMLGKKFPVT